MNDTELDLYAVPQECHAAIKYIMELLLHKICPIYRNIRNKFESLHEDQIDEGTIKIKDVYTLSSSQIKKCIMYFLEIIKLESHVNTYLKESRQFTIERLSWCITKLGTVETHLDDLKQNGVNHDLSETFVSPMYFVNWIDYTFDVLTKLATSVYRTDYKQNEILYREWKDEMVDHVTNLHMCIDELLLSAMTLCKYCLDEDQPILKARCHVVLRETKALFSELINVDITKSIKITPELLKLPVMPSNVNILIDVLKDVLYVLETNTNTALLTLLIHCSVYSTSPVDVLRDHFSQVKEFFCPCHNENLEDVDIETCKVVMNFDLYNERLLQIGSFAVSCSSDQKRILTLRSCLSSLESLDPHLVPAISTTAVSDHVTLLVNFWKQEVQEIRDTVFLIVDPVAFVERSKIYMKELMVGVEKQDFHKNRDAWAIIINIGTVVHEFFSVYKKYEPDALIEDKELDILLDNLCKAEKECKLVFNIFTNDDSTCVIDDESRPKITFANFSMRVKLLYSLVKKIHELFHPKDDDQLLGYDLCDEDAPKDATHTINPNTMHSRKRPAINITRSIFARTSTVSKPNQIMFLHKLTKHLNVKKTENDELNFSAQVSELFQFEPKNQLPIGRAKEVSLRRAVIGKSGAFPFIRKMNSTFDVEKDDEKCKEGILNDTTSLQISEILNQINDITEIISTTVSIRRDKNGSLMRMNKYSDSIQKTAVLDDTASISINSNVTQPSNVTTLERISDLDLVDNKLHSLKAQSQLETNL